MIIDTTYTKIERKMDIADIQQQLAATANDPNLTIITGHWWDNSAGRFISHAEYLEFKDDKGH